MLVMSMMVVLTGCIYNPNSRSFGSFQDIDKSIDNVDDEQDATDIVEKSKDAADENAKKTYDAISEKSDEEYYKGLDKLLTPQEKSDMSLGEMMLYNFYDFYLQFKASAPALCIVFIVVGMILYFSARGNKSLKRFGLFGLAIGFPVIILLIVYGIGYLNGIYLSN